MHRCPTRRVFSGTGLELVTRPATIRYLDHSATAALCQLARLYYYVMTFVRVSKPRPSTLTDHSTHLQEIRPARFLRLSLALAISTMEVTVRFSAVSPQFGGREYPEGCQGPPPFLPLSPTSREDLWLDGYLENPMP
ncbi:hypothetical protein TNCV_867711 [Trichonephila clavipes]|nr:hypothetical protein TNCV_867711 [Trichonephila clavipes]